MKEKKKLPLASLSSLSFFETELRTADTENLKRGWVFSIPLAFFAEIDASGQLHAGRCPLLSRFDDLQRVPSPNPGGRVRGCVLVKKDAFLTKLRGWRSHEWRHHPQTPHLVKISNISLSVGTVAACDIADTFVSSSSCGSVQQVLLLKYLWSELAQQYPRAARFE
jgi:hypothetical protein